MPVLAASDRIAIFLVPFWVYDVEREEIVTYVSTRGLHKGSQIMANKGQMKYPNRRVFISNTRNHMIQRY